MPGISNSASFSSIPIPRPASVYCVTRLVSRWRASGCDTYIRLNERRLRGGERRPRSDLEVFSGRRLRLGPVLGQHLLVVVRRGILERKRNVSVPRPSEPPRANRPQCAPSFVTFSRNSISIEHRRISLLVQALTSFFYYLLLHFGATIK